MAEKLPDLDGGVPGAQWVQRLTRDDAEDVMSCLDQYCQHYAKIRPAWFNDFFTIMVWFPADANARFPNHTPAGSFKLIPKFRNNFGSADLLRFAMDIYSQGFIPVEIIRDGKAKFYALEKAEVLAGELETMMIMVNEMIGTDANAENQ
jgi:hypothetical protein